MSLFIFMQERDSGGLLPHAPVRLDSGEGRRLHAREASAHLAAFEAVASSAHLPPSPAKQRLNSSCCNLTINPHSQPFLIEGSGFMKYVWLNFVELLLFMALVTLS
jgi:hypothetical protein